MKTYATSGTIGDSYITCLKLAPIIAAEGEIRVNHYTKHHYLWPKIAEIYQACFPESITISFVNDRDMESPRIHSDFEADDLPYNAFPDWEFAENEYYDYTAVVPEAGKGNEPWRKIPEEELSDIFSKEKCCQIVRDDGKYTLAQAMQIIKDSKKVYCYQGLMAFVALSMKRPTTVYIGPDHELDAFKRRLCPEWSTWLGGRIKRTND